MYDNNILKLYIDILYIVAWLVLERDLGWLNVFLAQ